MMYSLVKSRIPAGRLSAQRLLLLLFFICRKWGSGLCICVLLYFGTEYQNARSFEIILQIHLLICYLLDVIIYLFIELTLFVSYAFMFVTAGLRFVPNKPEIKKKEVIIIRLLEDKPHVQTFSFVFKDRNRPHANKQFSNKKYVLIQE